LYYCSHKEESKAYHEKWRKSHPEYHAEKTRNWRIENIESVRLHRRETYKLNREVISKYKKEWREPRREALNQSRREYYRAHKEEINSRKRELYLVNADKRREYMKDWRTGHPESVSASLSKYLQSHLREHSEKEQRRRSAKRSSGGSFTRQEWVELCNYYGNKCLCCGKSDVRLTVNHIIPVKLGGRGSIDNIQPLCISCNSKKNARHIDYRVDKFEMSTQERLF
jgi:5-methylcytosine-specific restriction endonuclease McrA